MSARGKDIARCLLVAGLGAGAIVGVLCLFVWLASTAKAQDKKAVNVEVSHVQ